MPQIACDIFGVPIITSRDAFPARLNRKWQTDIAKPDSSNDAYAFPPQRYDDERKSNGSEFWTAPRHAFV